MTAFDDLMKTLAGIGEWSEWEKTFAWFPVMSIYKKIIWMKHAMKRTRGIMTGCSEGYWEKEYQDMTE